MDKNKKELIELILDKLIILDEFENKIRDTFNIDAWDESVIGKASDIGFIGIPMILEVETSDYLNDLLYDCITKEITKKEYYKKLEKYLKEGKWGKQRTD